MNKHHYYYLFGLLFLSACYPSHKFVQPDLVPAAAIAEAISDEVENSLIEKNTPLPETWWMLYNDKQLSSLIDKALARNPTLQIAQERILVVLHEAEKRYSVLKPNFSLSGDIQRNKLSKTGVFPDTVPATPPIASGLQSVPVGPLIPFYFTLYEAAINFKYNLDLWCKNKNAFLSALDEMQARLADEAFTRLTLSIAVAQAYFQLQIDYQHHEILQQLVTNRTEYESFIGKRLEHNLDTDLLRNSAHINLTTSMQELIQLEGMIAIHEHQLKALLADRFDETIEPQDVLHKELPKIPLPEALPLHLIAMRPDIMSQLWLLEAACRQIEIAKAGFYPDVNLMGFLGYQTIHPERFFEWKSGFGVAESAFTLPLFDGGYLRANLAGKQVDYDLAILKYNQLILDAVKEVLDGLTLLKINYEQLAFYKKETLDQQSNLTLTSLRLEHHIATGLDRLNSEQLYLVARDQEITALGNTLQASLQLIKALGGGYDACIINEVK